MTDPKFEITRIGYYDNDSIAVLKETKESERLHNGYKDVLEKCVKKQCKSKKDQLMNECEFNAAKDLLSQQYILLRFTHRAGYDTSDLLKFIKSCNNDYDKMKRYCEDNKISFAYYSID